MRPFLLTLLVLVCCFGCRRHEQLEYQGKPLSYWEAQAASKKADKRRAAATALGEIGPKGLHSLIILSADRDHHIRIAASLAVQGMGQKATPETIAELKKLLEDSNKKVRAGATKALIQALVDMGQKGLPQLIELLKYPDPNVRVAAAKAMLRTDVKTKKKVNRALIEMLSDENAAVREAADRSLRILNSAKSAPKIRIPHSSK